MKTPQTKSSKYTRFLPDRSLCVAVRRFGAHTGTEFRRTSQLNIRVVCAASSAAGSSSSEGNFNPYEVLGVSPIVGFEVVNEAYARKHKDAQERKDEATAAQVAADVEAGIFLVPWTVEGDHRVIYEAVGVFVSKYINMTTRKGKHMMNCTTDDGEGYQLADGEDGMSPSSEDVDSSGARLNKVMLTLALGSFRKIDLAGEYSLGPNRIRTCFNVAFILEWQCYLLAAVLNSAGYSFGMGMLLVAALFSAGVLSSLDYFIYELVVCVALKGLMVLWTLHVVSIFEWECYMLCFGALDDAVLLKVALFLLLDSTVDVQYLSLLLKPSAGKRRSWKLNLVDLKTTPRIRPRNARKEFVTKINLPKGPDIPCNIINSCNGLLCLFDESDFGPCSDGPICICNPLLGELVTLPKSPSVRPMSDLLSCAAFGYSPMTDQYKVVRSFWSCVIGPVTDREMWEAEIYTLCEQFRAVPEPFEFGPVHTEWSDYMYVGVLQGCLSICDFGQGGVAEVWVMKDYGVKESWSKDFVLENMMNDGCRFCYYEPILILEGGQILIFEHNAYSILLYDPGSNCLRKVHTFGYSGTCFFGLAHVPSLLSL
ncbi:hypothetical protein RHSIM_Rhsim04G0044500 [Rhododendron simsii]|uniref:F-box associated beta-propeller type 3 domain-containing protein n=1 Tax=Rhododendron simsii TaxID=118357 RepID=A0A834H410_RHOSS|nr:hypothetical protein RHSIM_Rhsim04G0044500 [Rhododendron simsii]